MRAWMRGWRSAFGALFVWTLIAAACAGSGGAELGQQRIFPVLVDSPGSTITTTRAPPVTAITTTSTPTTTIANATTANTTTATTLSLVRQFDVVVVGDTAGAVTTAVQAAELGASVVILADTGYFGGQASASGVSTMDEGGIPISGMYARLVRDLEAYYKGVPMNKCYYAFGRGRPANCPDPLAVKTIFEHWLTDAGVEIVLGVRAVGVLQDGNSVFGVAGSDGIAYEGLVADGTDFSDLFPLIDGLEYDTGNGECTQNTTWATVVNWYPDGRPAELSIPEDVPDALKRVYGDAAVENWLNSYRGGTSSDGITFDQIGFDWGKRSSKPMVFGSPDGNGAEGYRGMADARPEVVGYSNAPAITRTGINDRNDSQVTVAGFEDAGGERTAQFMRAQDKVYLYLWYLEHELGIDDWGLANDLQFETAVRMFNNPSIPDEIEQYFTPMPYVREGRRLVNTAERLTWRDITDDLRRTDQFGNSVMVGNYRVDQHGCRQPDEEWSRYGNYDVPLGIFISAEIDGFVPALVRTAGVDRSASSTLRMQPTEINGGQVAGVLLALAIEHDTTLMDVYESYADEVRDILLELGAAVDVPEQ